MNLVARWMRRPGMTMVLSRSRLLGRRASRSKVGDFSAGIGYIGAIDHLPKARRAWGRPADLGGRADQMGHAR